MGEVGNTIKDKSSDVSAQSADAFSKATTKLEKRESAAAKKLKDLLAKQLGLIAKDGSVADVFTMSQNAANGALGQSDALAAIRAELMTPWEHRGWGVW